MVEFFDLGDERAKRQGSGGDGGMSDLEARIRRLEDDSKETRTDFKAVRADLNDIKVKLSGIEGRLAGMPSTWQIVGICAGLIGIVIASGGGLLAILRALAP
jgi:hypothetical protein